MHHATSMRGFDKVFRDIIYVGNVTMKKELFGNCSIGNPKACMGYRKIAMFMWNECSDP